jgi:hypothetical protein
MAGYGYDKRKRAKRARGVGWVDSSKMRRAATLENRVGHRALDRQLASLYNAGTYLPLLVLESSGMKGCPRRQGRVRGVCREESETRTCLEPQGVRPRELSR